MTKSMTTHDLKTRCPWCGYKADCASDLDGSPKPPIDGSLSLCIQCGEWSFFDSKARYGLRKPTDEEFVEIGADAQCRKIRGAWAQMNNERENR